MSEDSQTNKNATSSAQGKGSPGAITHGVSIFVHILLLAPVIYIIALAFSKYSFFSWHPICMGLGAGFFAMEAIFAISGESYLSMRLSRANRVTIHWILQTTGLCLIYIGLIIIATNKNNHGYPHFVSNHANLGLSTIVLTTVVAAGGILANNARWFYPKVRPVLLKVIHATAGIGISTLLAASIITGCYSHWWPGGKVGRDLVISAFFFAGFLILVKPVLGAVSRIKVICKPATSGGT